MPDQNQWGQQAGSTFGQPSNQVNDLRIPPPNLPIKPTVPPTVGSVSPTPAFSSLPNQSAPSSFSPAPKPTIPPTGVPSTQTLPPMSVPPKPTTPIPSFPSAPSLVPPRPPQPSISSPPPPVLPSPQKPPVVPTPPTPTPPGPQNLKSSVRTMEDDLAALKKGQSPVGFGMQKEAGISTQIPVPTTPVPPVAVRQNPPIFSGQKPAVQGIELGKIEKSKPLPFIPIPPQPVSRNLPPLPKNLAPSPIPVSESQIEIPPSSRMSVSPTILIVALVMLVIVGFSVWFFVYHKPSAKVTDQPTPSGSIIVTATPVPGIETVFPVVDSVTIEVGSDVFVRFKDIVDAQIFDIGKVGLYKVFKPQKANGEEYTFNEFMSGSGIQTPQDMVASIDDRAFYVTAMRMSNNVIGYGFIVRVNNENNLKTAISIWENTMTEALKNLFVFDISKAASQNFLDNIYQDTQIRYKNFPDPTITIDFAIVKAENQENYLVFTNSREHIYSIIDKVHTIQSSNTPIPTL